MNLFSTCLSLLPVDWQQHESFLFRVFVLFIVFKIEIIKIFFSFRFTRKQYAYGDLSEDLENLATSLVIANLSFFFI